MKLFGKKCILILYQQLVILKSLFMSFITHPLNITESPWDDLKHNLIMKIQQHSGEI